MLKLNPLTLKKIQRFKSIKRGYYSAIILFILIIISVFGELFVNNRALLVKYDGKYYFPTYGQMIPGTTFNLGHDYETNYRELKEKLKNDHKNFVIMPIVPFNAFENDLIEGDYPPTPPSPKDKHYLGTDSSGRDVLARLLYGFRIAMGFSLILLILNYSIGIFVGCIMGYVGGKFDLIFQRLIEILTNVPFLYIVIIISSIVVPSFMMLILIMAFFGWMGMTWYMRTATYKEKAREYVLAAKALGASNFRIILRHILPNTVSLIITFIPFSIASGIASLTSLDYLGFGLPPPSPSFGELLKQGTENMNAYWLASSVVVTIVCILIMVTFIGEAIREAFDPKRHTTYE